MSEEGKEMLKARLCFGHLGGTLGNRLFDQMVALSWLRASEENPKEYVITPKGEEEFKNLGVDLYKRRRR